MVPEMLGEDGVRLLAQELGMGTDGELVKAEGDGRETHSSGDFCVSITAATGMPKFDTGPQKSTQRCQPCASRVVIELCRLEVDN